MRAIRRAFAKLGTFLSRNRAERELAREIKAHLTLAQDEFERRGMSSSDARLAARRALGGVEQTKELHRDERSLVWLEQAVQDLRHAGRALARTPGFTFIAVITLALGIGVNTTLFSTFNAVALKPLPVAEPDQVKRFERWFESGSRGNVQYAFSYPEYVYCRDHSHQFSSLVAASWLFGVLTAPASSGSSQRLAVQLVSANYFADLGINLLLGRGFLPDEDRTPGADTVAVLSYSFWHRGFNRDPRVLGRVIKLNGAAFTIVGITPEPFTGTSVDPQVPDVWVPLSMQAQLVPGKDWRTQPAEHTLQIFARLRPSTVLKTAQSEADLLVRQYTATYQEKSTSFFPRDRTKLVTLQRTTYFPNTDDIRFRALVSALMLIVGLVLFVACANVGNMLLARGAARQREISTRLALGGSRGRIIRQLLTESVFLSCLGGAAALVISVWTTKLLGIFLQKNAMLIGGDFSAVNLAPDMRVLAYVMAVSLAAGIFFGLSPALQFTRRDITSALKDQGAGLGQLQGSRLRSFLVGAQVSVSMLLLATAGLLTRGLIRSQDAAPGFETRNVFVLAGNFADFGSDSAKGVARQKLIVERLRQQPEFAAAALGNPPFGGTWTPPIIVGDSRGLTRGWTLASYASDTYLDLLRIPLLRGRNFTLQEAAANPPLAIISDSTARRFWPNEDPVGKLFTLDMDFRGTLADFEVIGIVKDVRFANLTRIDPAHVYLPAGAPRGAEFASVLLRIQGDRQRALAAVETTVAAFDKSLLSDLRLINLEDGVVSMQRAMSQAFALLAAILAALALTLAGVGIYGVVAYLVSKQTREIGVRMALGATHGAILKNVVVAGLRPVFVGITMGLAAAAGLSWLLHATLVFPGAMDFFYGVPFYDPATFAGISCFVLGVAAIASTLPACRAVRVDPMIALRYE